MKECLRFRFGADGPLSHTMLAESRRSSLVARSPGSPGALRRRSGRFRRPCGPFRGHPAPVSHPDRRRGAHPGRGPQAHRAHQVACQRIPQRHCLGLESAPHPQPDQPPIPARSPALTHSAVAALSLEIALASSPPIRSRHAATAGESPGLGAYRSTVSSLGSVHRRETAKPIPVPLTASIWSVLGEAAIDQHLPGSLIVPLIDLLDHRHHLAGIAAHGHHLHSHDELAVGGRGELEVKAGRKPPSPIFITVAPASVVEAPRLLAVLRLLAGLQLRQPIQRLPNPLAALAGGALTSRWSAAVAGGRIFAPTPPAMPRPGPPARPAPPPNVGRRRNGCGLGLGPHPHPVLGHPLEVDQPLGQEGRHALGQQPVQQFDPVGAEVGQGVVVDRDITEEPAIGVVVAAQPVELAGPLPTPSMVA